ncbi:hypothetical protein V8C86DRAFT_3024333 [Haematococcus lacustris]
MAGYLSQMAGYLSQIASPCPSVGSFQPASTAIDPISMTPSILRQSTGFDDPCQGYTALHWYSCTEAMGQALALKEQPCQGAAMLQRSTEQSKAYHPRKLPVAHNIDGEQPLRAMGNQRSAGEATGGAVALTPPSTARATLHATSLLDLPEALLGDIASLAVQLGDGKALSLACRAFSLANLQRAPAFHFPLERLRCDQLLTRRAIVALRARNSKLTFDILHQPRKELLTHVLAKLGPCAAAEACKLSYSGPCRRGRFKVLDCSPRLAQHLLGGFPNLTALSLHGYSVSSSGLASLLCHPQLSLQLQQLDLTSTTILQLQQQPGAVALDGPFHGARLKQLRLDIACMGQHEPHLPDLQPLAQHLTQLHLQSSSRLSRDDMALDLLLDQLLPLAQLQVLTVNGVGGLEGLPELLPALPQLHTLQLPDIPPRRAVKWLSWLWVIPTTERS